MSLKLSNVIIIDRKLLPRYNKAFTLAEVLITLSIIGVVAAIAIPSLINFQSDRAARDKIKKAISAYEEMMGIYITENNLSGTPVNFNCADLDTYFKIVEHNVNGDECSFTTSDGTLWQFTDGTGQVTVASSVNNPKYSVDMAVSANGIPNELGLEITRRNNPEVVVPSDSTHAFSSAAAFWEFVKTKGGNGAGSTNNGGGNNNPSAS